MDVSRVHIHIGRLIVRGFPAGEGRELANTFRDRMAESLPPDCLRSLTENRAVDGVARVQFTLKPGESAVLRGERLASCIGREITR